MSSNVISDQKSLSSTDLKRLNGKSLSLNIYWYGWHHLAFLLIIFHIYHLVQVWATYGSRATCVPPSTNIIWPANTSFGFIKHKNYLLKYIIFSKNSNKICPYDTDAGPHRPILFIVWPASQKELPTPDIVHKFHGGPWIS
jgi:hypothetical protein